MVIASDEKFDINLPYVCAIFRCAIFSKFNVEQIFNFIAKIFEIFHLNCALLNFELNESEKDRLRERESENIKKERNILHATVRTKQNFRLDISNEFHGMNIIAYKNLVYLPWRARNVFLVLWWCFCCCCVLVFIWKNQSTGSEKVNFQQCRSEQKSKNCHYTKDSYFCWGVVGWLIFIFV